MWRSNGARECVAVQCVIILLLNVTRKDCVCVCGRGGRGREGEAERERGGKVYIARINIWAYVYFCMVVLRVSLVVYKPLCLGFPSHAYKRGSNRGL